MKTRILFILFWVSVTMSTSAENRLYIPQITASLKTEAEQILELFNEKDYVVIALRDKGEITQNQLLHQIITSPFFIHNIKYIFTDKAVINQEQLINQSLSSSKKKDLLNICRNTTPEICCYHYNFYEFLEDIRQSNQKGFPQQKLTLIPANMRWEWEKITTPEEYEQKRKNYTVLSDSIIAGNIIRICQTKNIKKALILLEDQRAIHFPESFKWDTTFIYTNGQKQIRLDKNALKSSTYDYLKNQWGNHITNVLLNNSVSPETTVLFHYLPLSPIGNDTLLWKYPVVPNVYDICKLTYKQTFDYYIYYNKPETFNYITGIPGIIDKTFRKEFDRRAQFISNKPSKTIYPYYNRKKSWQAKDFIKN